MNDIIDKILNDSYIENQWSEEKENEEEERYRKKGNFIGNTYVDNNGDMYIPKEEKENE